MAFQIDSTASTGFLAPQAYCRVEGISVTKATLTFRLRRYKDRSGLPAFADDQYTAPYALTGVNPLQQAYDYLLAQPEFAGAANVFETGQPQE